MLRPQLRLPDADTTRTPPWTPVWSSHCCRLLLLLLLLCCYFGVSRTWRMLQSRLLLPAVRYFLNSAPYPFPPLAQRCLSHTQKVVKMQIKLETNWAGRQHTQCSFWRGVHVRMFVCVCVFVLLCGPSMGWGFSPFCCFVVRWISCLQMTWIVWTMIADMQIFFPGAMFAWRPTHSPPHLANALYIYFGSKYRIRERLNNP